MRVLNSSKKSFAKTGLLAAALIAGGATIAPAAVLHSQAPPSQAPSISLTITGTVTSASSPNGYFNHPIAVGDTYTSIYTFSAATPDSNPDPTMGEYHFTTGPGFGMTTTINGMTFQSATDVAGNNRIEVFHANQFNEDRYSVWSSANEQYNSQFVDFQGLQMFDFSKTANVSDALLLSPPNLASYALQQFEVRVGDGLMRDSFFGNVKSITAGAVPEPASVGLLATGAITTLLRRRRA